MIRRIHIHAGPTDRIDGAHVGRLLVIESSDGQTYLITDPLRAIGRELFAELLQEIPFDSALIEEVQPASYGGQRRDIEVWVGFDKKTWSFWLRSLPDEDSSVPLHELTWQEARTILWARES